MCKHYIIYICLCKHKIIIIGLIGRPNINVCIDCIAMEHGNYIEEEMMIITYNRIICYNFNEKCYY